MCLLISIPYSVSEIEWVKSNYSFLVISLIVKSLSIYYFSALHKTTVEDIRYMRSWWNKILFCLNIRKKTFEGHLNRQSPDEKCAKALVSYYHPFIKKSFTAVFACIAYFSSKDLKDKSVWHLEALYFIHSSNTDTSINKSARQTSIEKFFIKGHFLIKIDLIYKSTTLAIAYCDQGWDKQWKIYKLQIMSQLRPFYMYNNNL